jgi:hypothetical protein
MAPQGSTTSNLALQGRKNRKQEPMTEGNAIRKAPGQRPPPLAGGQVQAVVGVLREQNCATSITPCPCHPQAQEKDSVLMTGRQQNQISSPTEPSPPQIRPTGRYTLPQPGEPTSAAYSAIPRTLKTVSQSQLQPCVSGTLGGTGCADEAPPTWTGPSRPRGGAETQKPSEPPVPGFLESSRIPGETTTPVPTAQDVFQQRNLDKGHSTKAISGEGDSSNNVDTPDPFPATVCESLGLIKTPHGIYLPETFYSNSDSTALESLLDRL